MRRTFLEPQNQASRPDERVVAQLHRDSSGVPGRSLDDDFAARVADDPRHDSERQSEGGEPRPLLDVQLDERIRQRTAFDEGPAADAAALLLTEDHDRPEAGPLHGLDRGDHAERAVELPTLRNGVQVRSGPDPGGGARPPEHVPRRIDLDLEPGVLHPAPRERVRLVLLGGIAKPVRSGAAPDRIELLEPVEDAHGGGIRTTRRLLARWRGRPLGSTMTP
jgi:hypothetical protein